MISRRRYAPVPFLVLALSCASPPTSTSPSTVATKSAATELRENCVSAADIQRALSARTMAFQDCYVDGLAVEPTLAGTVTLEVVVPPSGHVERVRAQSSTLSSARVVACIEEVASNLSFEQATCRTAQVVEYPVRLGRGSSEFALR